MAWNWNNSFQGAGQGAAAGSSAGPWGAVAGGVAGGLLGGLSEDSNATSARAAEQQFYHQLYLQEANQKWNENMSNTAHQREVADLKAAGLNPVLSANSGAAMGSVGTGQAAMEATAPTNAVQKMQLLLTAKQIANETKQTNANVDKIEAEKQNINADTANKEQQYTLTPDIVKASTDLQKAQTARERADKSKILQETITEKLNQKKIQIENEMRGMDLDKRKAYYYTEMQLYIKQLKRDLKSAGVEDNYIYQGIDHAFETVGKVFHAGSSTSTSTHTSAGKNTVNINKI